MKKLLLGAALAASVASCSPGSKEEQKDNSEKQLHTELSIPTRKKDKKTTTYEYNIYPDSTWSANGDTLGPDKGNYDNIFYQGQKYRRVKPIFGESVSYPQRKESGDLTILNGEDLHIMTPSLKKLHDIAIGNKVVDLQQKENNELGENKRDSFDEYPLDSLLVDKNGKKIGKKNVSEKFCYFKPKYVSISPYHVNNVVFGEEIDIFSPHCMFSQDGKTFYGFSETTDGYVIIREYIDPYSRFFKL